MKAHCSREKLKPGGPPPWLQATQDAWVPPGPSRGRRRGGPRSSPAHCWGEKGGRRRSREGGDQTCLVSPQAPSEIPAPPRAREGKGREEGEAAGRWGFPSFPKRNWDFGVQTASVQLCGVLLTPLEAPHPQRVARTWVLLTPASSPFLTSVSQRRPLSRARLLNSVPNHAAASVCRRSTFLTPVFAF